MACLQHATADFALRGDVAHEAAGKAVARAGGIAHLVERQRRSAEGMLTAAIAIAEKNGRAVLAMLDDQRARTEAP